VSKDSDSPTPTGTVLSPERRLFLASFASAVALPGPFLETVQALELPKEGRVDWAHGNKLLHESVAKDVEFALMYAGDKETGEWLRSFTGQESRVLIRHADILESLRRADPESVKKGIVLSHTHPARVVESNARVIRSGIPKEQAPVFATRALERERFEELKDFMSLPSGTDIFGSYNTLFNKFMALSGFSHGAVEHNVISERYRWSIKTRVESPANQSRMREYAAAVKAISGWLTAYPRNMNIVSDAWIKGTEWDAVTKNMQDRHEVIAYILLERLLWFPQESRRNVLALPGFSNLSAFMPLMNQTGTRQTEALQRRLARQIYVGEVSFAQALGQYTKELYDVCGVELTYERIAP
jgi:hypothetical protein